LSHRTFTDRMCGEFRPCSGFSRSITLCDHHLIRLHTFFISCTFKRFSFCSKFTESNRSDPHIWVCATVTLTLLISATHFRGVRSLKKWFVLVAYLIWLCTHYSIILFCDCIISQSFCFVNTFLKSFTNCSKFQIFSRIAVLGRIEHSLNSYIFNQIHT
jgi:hypothetical protein